MNANDKQFAIEIDENTILVDFRKNKAAISTQAGQARSLACRHFFGNSKGLMKVAGGIFLAGMTLNVYHVESICKKIWIVSTVSMKPDETRTIVAEYV